MLFEEISSDRSSHKLIGMPCARRDALRGYMVSFGRRLSLAQHRLALFRKDAGMVQVFDDILVFINHKLVDEMSTLETSTGVVPSLLFYASALYVEECRLIISHFPKSLSSFDSLLRTIYSYKNLMTDRGLADKELEKQLATPIIQGSAYHEIPFSVKWWTCLENFQHTSLCIPRALDPNVASDMDHLPGAGELPTIVMRPNKMGNPSEQQKVALEIYPSSIMSPLSTDTPSNGDQDGIRSEHRTVSVAEQDSPISN